MERRHLTLLATAAAAAVLAAPAGAGVPWREVDRGPAELTQLISPVVLLASQRDAAVGFSSGLPQKGIDALLGIDYRRNFVVAVFGEFGCRDRRTVVKSIARKGTLLRVKLVRRPPPNGQRECRKSYPTYRLLVVKKALLGRPYPTHGQATVARA